MWKIILTSFVLTIVYARKIDDVFGTWTHVASYPFMAHVPLCAEYVFERDPKNIDCACSDGKIATMVRTTLLKRRGNHTTKPPSYSNPVLLVDTPAEAIVDETCSCGSKVYIGRVIARFANPNYFVIYAKYSSEEYTDAYPFNAFVFARKMPRSEDLAAVLKTIEDLKNRKDMEMCSNDVNVNQ